MSLRAALALLLAIIANPALAHLTPNSEIQLDFAPGTVKADIVVPQAEFAYATGLATDNRPETLKLAQARVLADMAVQASDGRPWSITVDRIAFEKIAGPPDLHLNLTLVPPPGASARNLRWQWHVVSGQVPSHFALLVVSADLAGGVRGERELIGALTAKRPELEVNRGEAGLGSLFANAFRLGAHHIAEGYDHLLFLIALLLPASLIAVGGHWTSPRSQRETFRSLVLIVTAFTIGHSTTLILAAFFGLHLPAQPVEAGIALSVLVSAIHAARPLFPGYEPWVAGTFGLVHGLAFATLINNFGLGTSTRLTAIAGFNLGIEAVQLGVVLLTLPLLMIVSRWKHGPVLRQILAVFTAIAAILWLSQRLT